MSRHRRLAVVLGVLASAFAARVAGQALVAFVPWALPGWWPPMAAWYSGLVVYPLLLPIQLVILAAQAGQVARWWRRPPAAHPRRGRWLTRGAAGYAGVMLVRYTVAISLRGGWDEPWWAGGLIPVTFHLVLAGYLAVWGRGLRAPHRKP